MVGLAGRQIRPPFLIPGDVDMIFLNILKTSDEEDDEVCYSAWEEHMGLLSSAVKPIRKTIPFSVRSATAKTPSLTSTAVISVTQFIRSMTQFATKLYASLIEQQTGTVLECLPSRQREVATHAAFEVMIKKKIIPVAEVLGEPR